MSRCAWFFSATTRSSASILPLPQYRQQPLELGAHLLVLPRKRFTCVISARPQRLGVIGTEPGVRLSNGLGQHLLGRRGVLQGQQARAHDVQQFHAQSRPVVEPTIGARLDLLQPLQRRQRPPAGVVGAGVLRKSVIRKSLTSGRRFLVQRDSRLPTRDAGAGEDRDENGGGCADRHLVAGDALRQAVEGAVWPREDRLMVQIPVDVVCERVDRRYRSSGRFSSALRTIASRSPRSARRVDGSRARRSATDGSRLPAGCAPSDARERTAGRIPASSSYKTTPLEYTSVAMPSASPAICSGDA